jgi:mono/diheme cytochrome c family protein
VTSGRAKALRFRLPLVLPALGLVLLAGGCDQSMVNQPKYEVYEAADLFRDGKAMQDPVPGTIARGELAYRAALAERPELSLALVHRGRERFDIFCAPCHSPTGDGDGMIVQRGFPRPPSFHTERLRTAPTEHFIAVITVGYGVMYSYADRVPPADRWAIAAYIRALQLSQHAAVASLPEDVAGLLGETE